MLFNNDLMSLYQVYIYNICDYDYKPGLQEEAGVRHGHLAVDR